MKKNIWIINHYAGDMFFNKGGRHYWFAQNLRKRGYVPTIFCCNSKHDALSTFFDSKELFFEKRAEEIDTPFVFVKSTLYTGNGKKRLLNMLGFFVNVKKAAKIYSKRNGKPDVILASSVHPLTMVAGIQLARYFKVKCVCEVRDLWPEEIVAYSDKWTNDDLLIKWLYKGEKWIYKRANDIVFLQEGAYDYIREQGWDQDIPAEKVHYINNGVDLNAFENNKKTYLFQDEDLQNKETYKIVYTGSIRRANNVGTILDAAKKLWDTKVCFLIWGDGDELEHLKERCVEENIENVKFKGRVDKKFIPSITSMADTNLLHWAMSGDLKYGPSFNKMFEYLAAGRPILTTLQTPYSIILSNKCGIMTQDNTAESIEKSIREIIALPQEKLIEMGGNAREAAKKYDFVLLTDMLISVIEKGEKAQ